MVEVLANFLMNVILTISNAILSPFINGILVLFPSLSTYVSYFTQFLSLALTYVPSVCRLLLINNTMMATIFSFIVIKYTIYILTSSVRFAFRVYNYLKP